MNNFFKTLIGSVFVEEKNDLITLHGVKVYNLSLDILNIWSTSRIELNMFNVFKSSKIVFQKFFAYDFHYILEAIRDNYPKRKTRKSSIGDIKKALIELETNTFLKQVNENHESILNHSKLNLFQWTPLSHQETFFDIYDKKTQSYGLTGYLLSAAAGSGKTATCLMLAEMLESEMVIMVVPKNAVYKVWSRHLTEVYKNPQKHWIAADAKEYNHEKYIITHYEALEKTLEIVKKNLKPKTTIILDESHNLNNTESIRTQTFINLCKLTNSKHVIWSSGTPIKALGYESIPLLRTIDPLFTLDVENRFKKIFGKDATRALDILRNRMGMISYRVEKNEVMDNKPTTIVLKVKIPNGKNYTLSVVRDEMKAFIEKQLKFYKDNYKKYENIYNDCINTFQSTLKTKEDKTNFNIYLNYFDKIKSGYDPVSMAIEAKYCNNYEAKTIIPTLSSQSKVDFKNAKSVIKYVDLKVLGEALGLVLGKKRIDCHVDMVKSINFKNIIENSQKKVVIFTSYVQAVDAVASKVKQEGYHPIVVYGQTNKDLTNLITKFEKNPQDNPLVATYQSLSTAVPLISANTAVFLNSPFRDHELIQAKARIDRLGQDEPVFFIMVELDTADEPNVSTRSRDILEWSKSQIAQILGKSYDDTEVSDTISIEDYSENLQVALEYYTDQQNTHFFKNLSSNLSNDTITSSDNALLKASHPGYLNL